MWAALTRTLARLRAAMVVSLVSLLASGALVGAVLAATPAPEASKRTALVDAKQLLGELILPAGSVRLAESRAPRSLLGPAPQAAATPGFVDVHAFWRVFGDPQGVLLWMEEHQPPGSRLVSSASLSGPEGATWLAGFRRRGPAPELARGMLFVQTAGAPNGGTVIRADAEVAWRRMRPWWERIPADVQLVTVSVGAPGEPPSTTLTVGDEAKIDRIVRLLDRLPLTAPGAFHCPADDGPLLTLTFLGGATDDPLAQATADGSGCGGVTLSIRGHAAPALTGGPWLIHRLQSLLGLS
jgi:hypothetical protein